MYSYKRRTNCQTISLEMSNAISCILSYLHYFTIYLLFPCAWGTLCTSLFRCHGTEMALSAEHKIQGAWLDLEPTPPTLHIPKPNRLHLLISNPPPPPPPPNSIPKPTKSTMTSTIFIYNNHKTIYYNIHENTIEMSYTGISKTNWIWWKSPQRG